MVPDPVQHDLLHRVAVAVEGLRADLEVAEAGRRKGRLIREALRAVWAVCVVLMIYLAVLNLGLLGNRVDGRADVIGLKLDRLAR